MVKITLNARLEHRLNAVLSILPAELMEQIKKHLDEQEEWIQHSVLAEVARSTRSLRLEVGSKAAQSEIDAWDYTLNNLLKCTTLWRTKPKERMRSPELDTILAPIIAANRAKEYASMLAIPSKETKLLSFALHDDPFSSNSQQQSKDEWKEVQQEISAILNVLASMIAVAVAAWWAMGNNSIEAKIAVSMLGSVVVAVAESFLYVRFFQAKYTSKEKKAPPQRRVVSKRKKEQ